MSIPLTRREMLQCTASSALLMCANAGRSYGDIGNDASLPPVRAITRGPKYHWFGYYDKLQFDPTCRYVLGMEVDFEHRSPRADDTIKIGMVDLEDNDRWTELGESCSWGWQQGCMLQWIPGSQTKIIWNDLEGDRFVSHVVDTRTKTRRTIPHPIYTLSPDGKTAVAPDFGRLQEMRPGYGYPGVADPHQDEMVPKDSGIFRIDLETGRQELIVSLEQIAKFGQLHENMKDAKHYFNHLLFNTDGSRFIFLHRWRPDRGKGRFFTRMLTASVDGTDLCVVDPSGQTSHFIWRDPEHILAWTRPEGKDAGFYLFKDRSNHVERVGEDVMTRNGHCTYLPGNEWILNDTYPDREKREQHVYLYHVATGRRVPLGHFHLPKTYSGEWRCDTHPRFSPDGQKVVIDSPHGGNGRQLYLIDISAVVRAVPKS